MNQRIEIEKIHSGFRSAKSEPDTLLFMDGVLDWTWDSPDIAGIPVFHIPWMRSIHEGRGDDCPWILGFNNDRTDIDQINMQFFKGYDSYRPHP